jgi:hypothetical protein
MAEYQSQASRPVTSSDSLLPSMLSNNKKIDRRIPVQDWIAWSLVDSLSIVQYVLYPIVQNFWKIDSPEMPKNLSNSI